MGKITKFNPALNSTKYEATDYIDKVDHILIVAAGLPPLNRSFVIHLDVNRLKNLSNTKPLRVANSPEATGLPFSTQDWRFESTFTGNIHAQYIELSLTVNPHDPVHGISGYYYISGQYSSDPTKIFEITKGMPLKGKKLISITNKDTGKVLTLEKVVPYILEPVNHYVNSVAFTMEKTALWDDAKIHSGKPFYVKFDFGWLDGEASTHRNAEIAFSNTGLDYHGRIKDIYLNADTPTNLTVLTIKTIPIHTGVVYLKFQYIMHTLYKTMKIVLVGVQRERPV